MEAGFMKGPHLWPGHTQYFTPAIYHCADIPMGVYGCASSWATVRVPDFNLNGSFVNWRASSPRAHSITVLFTHPLFQGINPPSTPFWAQHKPVWRNTSFKGERRTSFLNKPGFQLAPGLYGWDEWASPCNWIRYHFTPLYLEDLQKSQCSRFKI